MEEIKVSVDKALTAEEVVELRVASGWEGELEEWEVCLPQNLVSVSSRDKSGKLVGVGFISGTVRHAEIVDMVVLPEYRKQGIGSRILQLLMDNAKEKHIRYLGLTYDKNFPWLKDFYKKYGFQEIDFAMWHKDSLE